jgi:hypothetical protein
METLIEDLKKVMNSGIEDKDKYMQMLINGFLRERDTELLTIQGVVKSLKDEKAPTLKDAYIAGYKKRALMSGLKYDEVSELNATTNFKCWKSFDLSL